MSTSEITVTVPLTFPEQRVRDLMCTAFEQACAYWCELERVDWPGGIAKDRSQLQMARDGEARGEPIYKWEYPFYPGVSLVFTGATDEGGGPPEPWILTREKMIAGLQTMGEKYPQHFATFMQENDDAETADVFLQCCLFGEIIFG